MSAKILLLGGTKEAEEYAQKISAKHPTDRLIVSLAGRTKSPEFQANETRIGGFGGIEGLVKYIQAEKITKLIDATHPFATQISQNAKKAAAKTGVKFEKIVRPEWVQRPEDIWIRAKDIHHACELTPEGATVFLALGSQHISAFRDREDCRFIVRMVDEPKAPIPLKIHNLVLSKPLLNAAAEGELLKAHQITHLVARNSGGKRSYAKIEAARLLSIPVILIDRPSD